jgi:ketosteroid isomerase-like protein
MSDVSSLENDLRAIEAINQRDVDAALANDADLMMSQWTDDFVLLAPAGPIMRGRAAIAEAFRSVERPEIVDYVLASGKIMRLLQRQADGSWKIHRGMTTMD